MSRLYDITPPVSPELKVWPGDTPPSREVLLDMAAGANLTLSTLRTTVHAGAHADAPSHYGKDADTIEKRSVETYLGPCQVVRVPAERGTRITPDQLTAKVRAPRILLATATYADPEHWNDDFAALSPELVEGLLGIRLRDSRTVADEWRPECKGVISDRVLKLV